MGKQIKEVYIGISMGARDILIKNGIEPGPKLGILLNSIREKVVEGELENSKAAIKQFIEEQN